MVSAIIREQVDKPLKWSEVEAALADLVQGLDDSVQKVLLLPPDFTRKHSGAGKITAVLYRYLQGREIHIMPALGTHVPMTEAEIRDMFGPEIPLECFVVHNWRSDCVHLGTIPGSFVSEVSEGILDYSIDVTVNKRIVSGDYDLIISIGQVLPHEVVGMANYSKNIFVGCGGPDMINKSHFLGAAYGMERLLGRDHSPVRRVYDYAQENFLQNVPLVYILTANSTAVNGGTGLTDLFGLYIGTDRKPFEAAVAMSQKQNINMMPKALEKIVVYLDEKEFKTTWLGCKAIYRTRMAMADGGELVIIAPGLRRFGEDEIIDGLIRKYGYSGREAILRVSQNQDLQENLSAAAHLIHGSVDGRFKVSIASPHLTEAEITGVGFAYLPYEEALERYPIHEWEPGFVDDGKIFYIDNPATGLWIAAERWEVQR